MAKTAAPEATPALLRVYPSPDLPPTEYLPGIGADGADLPADLARDLIDRGLAVTTAPADPAKED
jgi:hypothetical protein